MGAGGVVAVHVSQISTDSMETEAEKELGILRRST